MQLCIPSCVPVPMWDMGNCQALVWSRALLVNQHWDTTSVQVTVTFLGCQ